MLLLVEVLLAYAAAVALALVVVVESFAVVVMLLVDETETVTSVWAALAIFTVDALEAVEVVEEAFAEDDEAGAVLVLAEDELAEAAEEEAEEPLPFFTTIES